MQVGYIEFHIASFLENKKERESPFLVLGIIGCVITIVGIIIDYKCVYIHLNLSKGYRLSNMFSTFFIIIAFVIKVNIFITINLEIFVLCCILSVAEQSVGACLWRLRLNYRRQACCNKNSVFLFCPSSVSP